VRPLAVAAALVLAGLAAAAIWTWAQPDRFRAEASVVVRPGGDRIVPAVKALAESTLVESNVAQTLRLSSPPRVSASRHAGGLLTVSVEAGSRERARQIDAEAVLILVQKIAQRFGKTPGVTATVLDPAHAAEQTSPTPGHNFLVAGFAGIVAAIAVLLATRPRPRSSTQTTDPRVERRLQARIDEVAKRERALARRAGELALRERQLEERKRAEPPTAPAAPDPEPQVEPEAVPERQPAAAAETPRGSADPRSWTLRDLEALVEQKGASFPDHLDEWRSYLFFLREHADMDGRLPQNFDSLVVDVFGPLLS